LDRRVSAKRLQQFDFGVRKLDKNDRNAMRRQWMWLRHICAQHLLVELSRACEIGHDNRDVIEPSDHARDITQLDSDQMNFDQRALSKTLVDDAA
jgi:hypothetical protein